MAATRHSLGERLDGDEQRASTRVDRDMYARTVRAWHGMRKAKLRRSKKTCRPLGIEMSISYIYLNLLDILT
jgi:hypothetical protein